MANECRDLVNRFRLSRRSFIAASAAFAASRGATAAPNRREIAFEHGVASGDPLHDRVILWTRISPPNWYDEIEVQWQVARDPKMQRVVANGRVTTSLWRDFTVKVDVDGLEPAQTYYYRFEAPGARSVVGRTRTLPRADAQAARLASVSCANLPIGLFNVYALI
ncbi:MAG TPA: PhoD-like phosphatase N-terminal domain-containing protein, partial [Steroidobacteraceae bacterium]|nr:PhoD-like phosphatase N-terminal domain-containing protein [Steroidobacteraceae bacterium]